MTGLDPFCLVYDGLWKLIERNERLRLHIPTGNRIKYGIESEPKEEVSSNDLPELSLTPTGGIENLRSNCSTAKVTKRYVWGITTGELEVHKYEWMEWEIFRSLVDWECTLNSLSWCDCTGFVQDLRMTGAEVGTLLAELNRDIPGWSALLSIEVDMEFHRSILKPKLV